MKLRSARASVIQFAAVMSVISATTAAQDVRVWLSSEDLVYRLSEQEHASFRRRGYRVKQVVRIDDSIRYQTMLGMGSSLEPTTCYNLFQLPEELRRETVRNLVHPEDGIGMNLMRICIGTPDFTGDTWYTYAETAGDEADPALSDFSIERDRAHILPVLKLALEENPELRFYASPWSPPGWMTSTGDLIGGYLLPEYYNVYAEYFVKFVQAYAAEGIPVYAVTIQNEPGVDRSQETDPKWHYPSCRWTADQERDFIKNHLGPAFEQAGLETQIWTYDHNYNVADTPDGDDPGIAYPRIVMSDPQAAKFVDGVAFHGYAGRPEGMTQFHGEFPDVPLYFTEGSTFGVRGARKIIDILDNFASSYNAWVTMINEKGGPNNGPFEASRTCITLDSESKSVTYHFDYYMYGQFMKFVRPGATRIAVDVDADDLDAVGFLNSDESVVAVVVNSGSDEREFVMSWRGRHLRYTLPVRSVATFSWMGEP